MGVFEKLVFGFLLGLGCSSHADDCAQWFKDAKISIGRDCETKCAVLEVGMGTFDCPSKCKALCKKGGATDPILASFLYYPGLNATERKLVAEYPREALLIYKAKMEAENAAAKIFARNDTDDESDAFRHFVWAAHLRKEIGLELAKKFLDAHEADQSNADSSKSMDLANNRAGLLAAEQLLKSNNLSDGEIEKAALREIREKTLIVIRPKGFPK